MNKIDALRCELKCREMVEGTELAWESVVRIGNNAWSFINFLALDSIDHPSLELALGVVEGKPVWKGDALYWIANGARHLIDTGHNLSNGWSWNPPKPKPKTIIVEFPVEYVEWLASTSVGRKALESTITGRGALEIIKCK